MGEYKAPFIVVEIETSKFDLKSKEITRLSKLSQETHFSKILEAKVDINYKVAKLLTNALDWQVNFNAYKSGKQSLMIPVRRDPTSKVEKTIEHVPIEKIVEDLQTVAPQIMTPATPIAPPETYPIKKMTSYPEVLLVSYSDIKNCMQEKLGFRVEDVKMEEMAIAAIKKILHKGDNKKFYKFIIVDLDEVSIIIERFGRSIKALLSEAGISPSDVSLIAVSSTPSEK